MHGREADHINKPVDAVRQNWKSGLVTGMFCETTNKVLTKKPVI